MFALAPTATAAASVPETAPVSATVNGLELHVVFGGLNVVVMPVIAEPVATPPRVPTELLVTAAAKVPDSVIANWHPAGVVTLPIAVTGIGVPVKFAGSSVNVAVATWFDVSVNVQLA